MSPSNYIIYYSFFVNYSIISSNLMVCSSISFDFLGNSTLKRSNSELKSAILFSYSMILVLNYSICIFKCSISEAIKANLFSNLVISFSFLSNSDDKSANLSSN